MSKKVNALVGLLMIALTLGAVTPLIADEAVDQAFETLKTYEWGNDRAALNALDTAVAASHNDAAAQKALETRLVAVLAGDGSQAAKDYACRKLSLIGSAQAVPALAALLTEKTLSHMGRYALERMPCDEAIAALRAAMAKTSGLQRVGMINSLGVRRDAGSTAAIAALLGADDAQVAAAAAAALGSIGTADSAKALAAFDVPEGLVLAVADAKLTCAEKLLAGGDKAGALAIYMKLMTPGQPKHVKLAAMRGRLAATK